MNDEDWTIPPASSNQPNYAGNGDARTDSEVNHDLRFLSSEEFAKKLDAYFNQNHHTYLLNLDGFYVERTIQEFRRALELHYHRKDKGDQNAIIAFLESERIVDYSGALAGHGIGLHHFNNRAILVTKGPHIIAARAGCWNTIETILSGILGPIQLPYLYGWLRVARKAIIKGVLRPGQSLILCGPKNCGKSFSQEFIFTKILGNRVTQPYAFLAGQTSFNSDLAGAEHWMLNDEVPPDDIRIRRAIGVQIKRIASNDMIWCHKKGQEALTLPLLRRLTISCNDDDHSLKVLPPLDESLDGKIILCRVNRSSFPWPSVNRQWLMLQATIETELPAFAHFLDHYQIPEALRDQRYGIKGYLDPEIAAKVNRLGPEFELLDLARIAIEKNKAAVFPHEASALEIFDLIFDQDDLKDGLRRITQSPRGTGRILSSLVERKTPGIFSRILQGRILYRIEREV